MSDLSLLLHEKLIPWARQNAAQRFIVARPQMEAEQLPADVQLVPCPMRGKRNIVKNQRQYSNTRGVSAKWPEAGLNEVQKLKLACVLNGHIDYQLGNYRVQCGPGHFLFIPPGMPHSDGTQPYVDATKSSRCDVLFFLMHFNALQCWVSHSQPNQKRRQAANYLILNEHVTVVFRTFMEEVIANDKNSHHIVQELFNVFLSMLLREVENDRLQPVLSTISLTSLAATMPLPTNADFAVRLEQYLQSNLYKNLTIESVAGEMYFSPAQFSRNVRRATGKTFNQLLNEYRLEEAKKLLSTTQWTASAVAAFTGFKSPSYFRTFFRKRTGYTPSEFRLATCNLDETE